MQPENRLSSVSGEAEVRGSCVLVCLSPVSEEATVRMASLLREFHPCRFGAGAPTDSGTLEELLHPAWVSALVEAGIERACPGSFVNRLEIEYFRQVYRHEVLAVEMRCAEGGSDCPVRTVSFRVLSADRPVAQGVASVGTATRHCSNGEE